MTLLATLRKEATKHNLDVSSLNIEVLKQHNKSEISNQVVALSKLREKVRTHQELLKPLVFVKDFSKEILLKDNSQDKRKKQKIKKTKVKK